MSSCSFELRLLLLLLLSLLVETPSDHLIPELPRHELLKLLFHRLLALLREQLLFDVLVQGLHVEGLILLFVGLVVLDALDPPEDVLLQVLFLDLLPSVSVATDGAQSEEAFVCSEFTVLAESVKADNKGDFLGEEVLGFNVFPLAIFSVVLGVTIFVLVILDFLLVLAPFFVLFLLTQADF